MPRKKRVLLKTDIKNIYLKKVFAIGINNSQLLNCRHVFTLALILPQLFSALALNAHSNELKLGSDRETAKITSSTKAQHGRIVSELKKLQEQIKSKARPISLSAAVATGLQNNPELIRTYSTIQQFEWKLIAVKRQWYPTLQLQNGNPFAGVSWSTYVNDNYGASSKELQELEQSRKQAYRSEQTVIQPGVMASWNFIDPTRQPNINAADRALAQQKYLFEVSARNLILDIEKTYFSLQSTQQLIDSFQQIYAINKNQLDILEAQKDIGMVTVLDLEQTRSQLFSELNQLIFYTRNYINQAADLAKALALPHDQLAIPADPPVMQGKWVLSLNDTISIALKQREEILSSLAAAEAAEWSAVAAIRSYLPVFSLVASGNLYGWNGYESVVVPEDPGTSYARNRNWSAAVGIGFNWSIFDGGVQAANFQAASAESRQKRAQAASTEFQVVKQVRSSYGQMMTALVAVESAEQAYQSAQLAQEASRARFAVGIGDITSVVQTIEQLSQASRQRSEALLAYNNAISQLYRYSATWPADTQQELQERVKLMRNDQQPATPTMSGAAP
jgi:outer membrane protein TolC